MQIQLEMPQDAEMESYVLGSLMLEPLWRKVDIILNEDCFMDPDRKTVFRAIRALYESNQPVDIATVNKEVQKDRYRGSLGAFGIASLTNSVGSTIHLVQHSEMLRELAIRRALINEAHSLYLAAHDASRDTFGLLGEFEAAVKGLNIDVSVGIQNPKSAVEAAMSSYERSKNREPVKGSVNLHLGDLDDLIPSLLPGELVLFAARPSMGKTISALEVVKGNCIRGKRVVIFELEMTAEALVKRMACNMAAVNSFYAKKGELSQEEHARYFEALGRIGDFPLGIDDTGGIELYHLCSRIRKYVQRNPDTELVVVDYLQLITVGKNERVKNREGEVSLISRTLKALAKELGLPLIALSQLSRDAEKDKEYSLRHLRESGSLEQDADIVAFIHRHAYGKDPDEAVTDEAGNDITDRIDFIVKKYREGEIGTKSGIYHAHHQRISPTSQKFTMPSGGNEFDEFKPTKNFYEIEKDGEPF